MLIGISSLQKVNLSLDGRNVTGGRRCRLMLSNAFRCFGRLVPLRDLYLACHRLWGCTKIPLKAKKLVLPTINPFTYSTYLCLQGFQLFGVCGGVKRHVYDVLQSDLTELLFLGFQRSKHFSNLTV